MDRDIKQALIEIVGKESFTDLLIDMVSYSYDASDQDHRAEAAVWPNSSEQVSQILIREAPALAWPVQLFLQLAASYWTCAG